MCCKTIRGWASPPASWLMATGRFDAFRLSRPHLRRRLTVVAVIALVVTEIALLIWLSVLLADRSDEQPQNLGASALTSHKGHDAARWATAPAG